MRAGETSGGRYGSGMETDRDEIRSLIHAYCFHFDLNQPDEVAALFAADATIDYGPEHPPIVGRDAIAPTIAECRSVNVAADTRAAKVDAFNS